MNNLNQQVNYPVLVEKGLELHIKRLDLAHPPVCGNKYYKLKYNLKKAKSDGYQTILTFGGAFSNHIAATAQAAKVSGLKAIGVIRGEELASSWEKNSTLRIAANAGMQLHFVSRHAYRQKSTRTFLEDLTAQFGRFYHLPEGGSNALAVKGCEEILQVKDHNFNNICCSVGTGGTLAGIANSAGSNQKILGFSALKGDFLQEDIRKFTAKTNWDLSGDYHFGGYARVDKTLIDFINHFKLKTRIALDPIYTGKMLFGIMDLAAKDYFPRGSSVLAIHSGGQQGIEGMNEVLKRKNLPLIGL